MAARKKTPQPLFEEALWGFETLKRTYDAIEDVALNDLGLDVYPNQIEIISSEQMLDAYSSIGMPLMYRHWSFGKHFVHHEKLYQKGVAGLAYEIVINSNPCISYNMEESSMAIQALVMAHAAFGHNHFFKNNYLFRQWTDAEGILDYLEFAKGYIANCEEKHGPDAVEEILDAAHALMDYAVFRYRRPPKLSLKEQKERELERLVYEERTFNDLWRTVPAADGKEKSELEKEIQERKKDLHLPQENLLCFIEKYSPMLKAWQREVLCIVSTIAQYFYPQKQTKVMNEGCASFVHLYIMKELFSRGLLTEGAMMEILHSHTNVVFQPDYNDQRYNGINPYALGFAMMEDIRRICTEPTDEDRDWFPDLAGSDDWRAALKHAWANYRDDSFIQQYLSPHIIRKFRLFCLRDDSRKNYFTVLSIHNERGYRDTRDALARMYDISVLEPDIQVKDVDLLGDRHLHLHHEMRNDIPLDEVNRAAVLEHVRRLWGYDVNADAA
jgi:spore cortex formation protein SpoVR/YcgB (stage V sporulation)